MKGSGGGINRGGNSNDPHEEYTSIISNQNTGSNSANVDCSEIRFTTRIQDPTSALDSVNKGDNLILKLQTTNQLEVYNGNKERCGVIVDSKAKKLIDCMKKGNTYTVYVIKKIGRVCDVEVEKF